MSKRNGRGGIKMTKQESLDFLNECIKRAMNPSEAEIDKFKKIYNKYCEKQDTSSEIEFIAPMSVLFCEQTDAFMLHDNEYFGNNSKLEWKCNLNGNAIDNQKDDGKILSTAA